MTNPNYIPRNHPVRVALDNAANGRRPSKNDLDRLLNDTSAEHLPDGMSLDTFRDDVTQHINAISRIHDTGSHALARQAADDASAQLAARMKPEQRALNTTHTKADRDDIEAMLDRVFEI